MAASVIRHKFGMGERVRFDSPDQHASGVGTVYGVTLYADGEHEYLIELDGGGDVVSGVLEGEIAPSEQVAVMNEFTREFVRFCEIMSKPRRRYRGR